jgi:hypothetical protein
VKRKTLLVSLGFLALVIGAIVFTTMAEGGYRVEVCMEFQGRGTCRTASASTEEQALRTATENACALIASGVTESIQCTSHTPPASVKWLQRGK